jgi:5-methylcytosine-specific restriction endonuclease McrA
MKDTFSKKYREHFLKTHDYIRCEHCGVTAPCSVHHIVFRSEVGKESDVDNLKNLILLCNKCHSLFHSKKRIREPLVVERGLRKIFKKSIL